MPDLARIVQTYSAAADHFDALPFWPLFGRRTIDRLALAPGARVLDLCCGAGASALPAADAVGPSGSVVGVDIAEPLLAIARAKAAARGLAHVRFEAADVERLAFPPASFDAVVSVFGLFFAADMPALLARAHTWLADGGVLAITTWGQEVLAPGEEFFWDAVRAEDPSVSPSGHAARLETPERLAAVFHEAGLPPPSIEADTWTMPLHSPEAFWPVVLGTSNRGAIEALGAETASRVRQRVFAELERHQVRELRMSVLYANIRRSTGAAQ